GSRRLRSITSGSSDVTPGTCGSPSEMRMAPHERQRESSGETSSAEHHGHRAALAGSGSASVMRTLYLLERAAPPLKTSPNCPVTELLPILGPMASPSFASDTSESSTQ